MKSKTVSFARTRSRMGIAGCLALLLVFVFAGFATAQSTRPKNRFMTQFDQNGDGVVARSEYPGTDEQFQKLDADGNGSIGTAELPRMGQGGGMALFDTDSDGRLSADEFPGPADRFAEVDADGDGYCTQAEFRAARPARGMGRRGGMGSGMGKGMN